MDGTLKSPAFGISIRQRDVPPLKVARKSTTDEKKNLSKHHLILPNNTQICVETLLSQCVTNEDEQIDRKLEAKLRARLKKKKLTLFKPKNFILKNGKLRPIVTTNIKSGVFRSVMFVNNSTKKDKLHMVPSNVLYSQSTLPSRIQSLHNFSNDDWVVERTTKYMTNDWTRPIMLNTSSIRHNILDNNSHKKTIDWDFHNELKEVIRNGHDNDKIVNFVQNPTIHRLVTPDGFHLSTVPGSATKFTNQFLRLDSELGIEFKQLFQQPIHNDKNNIENEKSVEEVPVCRTRFSRAMRSPLQYDVDNFEKVPLPDQQNHTLEKSATEAFYEKAIPLKNSASDRNRCRTCKKVYLGRRKVIRHLKAFPEHEMPIPPKPTKTIESKSHIRTSTPPTLPPTERLFDFLIQKIRNAPIDEKSHILFREISDFVEKLEAIRSQLLCDDNTHSSVEYLDKHCSKIFGTQEGNYHISLDILEQLASGIDPTEFASAATADTNILPNQIDHNINVSLSSISESKIHLVEGISEESLLKTVDDLMRKEGRMGDGNFDHIEISDNAVEAVTLKNSGSTQPLLNLSLDLFKFDGT